MNIPLQQNPKIINLKVFTINEAPLFYGYEEEHQMFSVTDKAWIPKPSYFGHFGCREIEHCDMPDIVLYDIISPEDYSMLHDKGLIGQELSALYSKVQQLKAHLKALGVDGLDIMNPAEIKTPQQDAVLESLKIVEPEPITPDGIQKVLEIIKNNMGSPSLFDEIKKGVEGLSDQEKHTVALITKYMGR